MHVREIQLTNFMVHEAARLTLPASGITLITGPNGSGKSSYVEAVATAGWNKSIRKKSSRKTRGFRKTAAGAVAVTTASGLSIERTSTKSGSLKLQFREPGQVEPTSYATPSKAQEALTSIVGPYEVWYRSCVFSSKHASTFSTATDSARREILEELLDLDFVARAHEVAKVKLKEARAEVDKCDTRIRKIETETKVVEAYLDSQSDYEERHPKPDPYTALLTDSERAKIEKKIPEWEAERERVVERGKVVFAHRKAEADLKRAIESLNRAGTEEPPTEEEVDQVRAKWKQLDGQVTDLTAEMDALTKALHDCDLVLRDATNAHKVAKDRAHLLDNDQCPTCGQDIGQELAGELEAGLTSAKEELAVRTRQVEEVKASTDADLARAQSTLDQLRKERRELERQGRDMARQRKEYAEKAEWRAKLLAEKAAAEEVLAGSDVTEEESHTIGNTAERFYELVVQGRGKLEADERARADFHQKMARWEELMATLAKEVAEHEAVALNLEEQLEDAQAARIDAERKVAVAAEGVKVLDPKGARAHILGQALLAVQTISNQWLTKFTDTVRVELTPYTEWTKGTKVSIGLKVLGREDGDDYDDLSAGEQRVVDIAMMLAFAEVHRLANGVTDWGTLFLDEVLDAVDSDRAERVCEAFHEMARDRAVVIVTHNPIIRDRLNPVQEIEL